MAEGECGAWADKTTPEWAQGGKVTCQRPSGGVKGHNGPHSARVPPPTGGAPVTLSWAEDAQIRPDATREPESDDVVDQPPLVGATGPDAAVDVRELLVDALTSGHAQIEAQVLGHEDGDGNFVVDEVLKLTGIRFRP